jgi:hypothetical protein
MKKIIFLDFDGVITTRATKFRTFDPNCIFQLKRILEETNSYIVITSTWRLLYTFYDLQSLFEKAGIPRDRIFAMTRDRNNDGRGVEIKEWLDNVANPLHVKKYVIIDDDTFDMGEFTKETIKTKTECGLTQKEADEAIKKLKDET